MTEYHAPNLRPISEWFPNQDPGIDRSITIDTHQQRALVNEGLLVRSYLVSPRFGGSEEDAINHLYLTPAAAAEKNRWDEYIAKQLGLGAKGVSMEVKLDLLPNSVVPRSFLIQVSGGLTLNHRIHLFPPEHIDRTQAKEVLAQNSGFGYFYKDLLDSCKGVFLDLFSLTAGRTLARHIRFSELVDGAEEEAWSASLSQQTLELGGQTYAIELIGDEAHAPNSTYMAGWSKEAPFAPCASQENWAFAQWLRWQGYQTPSQEHFPVSNELNGGLMAMTHCGLANLPRLFYRIPTDHNDIYVLIKNPPTKVLKQVEPLLFIKTVQNAISVWSLNHLLLIQGFAATNECRFEQQDATITVSWPQGEVVTFTLEDGRITKMAHTTPGENA